MSRGKKSNVLGTVFLLISISIYSLNQFVFGGIEGWLSVSSFMVLGCFLVAVGFYRGDDKIINKVEGVLKSVFGKRNKG